MVGFRWGLSPRFVDGCLPVVSSYCGERERVKVSLLLRTLILSDQGLTLMTSFHLNCFLSPDTPVLGVRASTYEFRRNSNTQSIVDGNIAWYTFCVLKVRFPPTPSLA